MKINSIRSSFLAVVAVFLAAMFTVPFAAPAQEEEPEVILTLEGNYKGQVQFVFTGDAIRYEHRTIPPIYPYPTDVTVDGRPWADLDQPFKLGFTPDFENVTIKEKVDGSKVIMGWGRDRVELTLNDPEGSVRFQMQKPADPDPPAVRATHFAVPLIVKNIHSSSRPVLIPMGPRQIELQSERNRRAELEIALKILEEKPVTPETSRSREESIDLLRRQITAADRRIEQLEELAKKEEAARPAAAAEVERLLDARERVAAQIQRLEQDQDADADWKAGQIESWRRKLADLDLEIVKLNGRLPKEGTAARPAAQSVEQRLKKAFDMREKLEAELRAIEQEPEVEAQEKAKTIPLVSREQRIESLRRQIDNLDRTIRTLKDQAARDAQGTNGAKPAPTAATTDKTVASAPGRETDNAKELSLTARQAIAGDLNRQGFRLLRTLAEEKETENKFISPYSIDSAFGMVYTGAVGRTQEEIRSVLGMPEEAGTADTFFHEIADQYHAAEKVDVLVSNSVWVDQRVTDLVRPDYRRTIENYYGGAFYVEDFTKKAIVVDKVNALVDRNTKGMIREVITTDDLTERIRMILLNTLFFEAKWLYPFKEDQTRPMPFYRFGGGSKQVKMMYQKRRFDYFCCEEDNVHAVVLPYENPRFDLVALMPVDPGADQGQTAMKSILAKIGDKLGSWLSKPSPYETRLWLPKVDLTDSMRLKDPLKELGMPSAFSPIADFSGMFDYSKKPSNERFYIEKVIHKTALKMDEYSTKAAAVTAIIGAFGGGVSQPPPENVFRADRPYLVLIRDNLTGLILFMGRINDPGVEASAEDGPAMPSFGLPPNGPGSTTPGTNSLPGFRPAAQTNPRQTTTARPGSATTRTGEPAAAKAGDGQNKRNPYAGVPLWDKERDGQPEIQLRDLVNDAAKRAEADLRTLGSVRITSIDAEHSNADVDFTVVDEYRKIVHFIDEIEKQTPRLSWRRIEIRVEPTGNRFRIEDNAKTDSPQADAVRKYRLTGQIRVITYTPAKQETVPAAGDSAAAKEKAKSERVDVDPGDPDFLAKLYDLSLALPEDALVTQLRFNSGNCDLTIQARNRRNTPDRYLVFPYWRIARLSQRIISNDICSFAVSLVRNDDPSEPQKDSATSAVMIEHIVALNIFDPDRTPIKTADSSKSSGMPAPYSTLPKPPESHATDLERQLEEASKTRAELQSLLRTIEQTPGVTKEQTELIRQRIEVYDQRIEQLQTQLKALRP